MPKGLCLFVLYFAFGGVLNDNPEWIRPAGEETAALVNYLARFIAKDTKVSF